MKHPLWILLILAFVSACAGGGFQVPLVSSESIPETTYSPLTPTRTRLQQSNVDLIHGVSQISDLNLNVDGPNAKASLQGMVKISPVNNLPPIQVPLHLEGPIEPEEMTAYMRPVNGTELERLQARAGAALVCLSKDCSTSFIDIYVEYMGQMYHHQVESKKPIKTKTKPQKKDKEQPQTSRPQPDSDKEVEEEVQPEEEVQEDKLSEKEPEFELGTYVGDPEKDVQVLFPDKKSKENKKKDSESKDTSKKDKTSEVPQFPSKETSPSVEQAIGAPSDGSLINASNFLDYQKANPKAGFKFMYPNQYPKKPRYFGTNDLLAILVRMGQFSEKNVDGYVLRVNTISQEEGGNIGHQSHQNGLDADIAYYFKNVQQLTRMGIAVNGREVSKEWMAEKQWELFKHTVATQNVDRIGVDIAVKKALCDIAIKNDELIDGKAEDKVVFETLRALSAWPKHFDHYHLRIKCSSTQKRCRQLAPAPMETGC